MCSCLFFCRWESWTVGVFSTGIPGCPNCAVVLMGSRHTHPEVQTWPVGLLGKFSSLAPFQRLLSSPNFGRWLKLIVGEREPVTGSCCWHRFVFRSRMLVSCQAGYLALGAQMWSCPVRMFMHYRLFPIGGVSCLMLCGGSSRLQGYLVGTASLRAFWKIHFKTSYWHIILRKNGLQPSENGRKISCRRKFWRQWDCYRVN